MTDSRVVLADSVHSTIVLWRGIDAARRHCFAEAISHYDEAIVLEPDYPLAHWNKATSFLCMGDYISGFKELDWRWQVWPWWEYGTLGPHVLRLRNELPPWRGDDLTGKRLLFYNEMGYGDCIQQLRYVPVLQSLGIKVTALVEPPLLRLAQTLDADVITELPQDISIFDRRCSMFGVMAALCQTVEDIPRSPYLPLHWESSGGGKLGLAWSGRTQTEFTSDTEFLSRLNVTGYEPQSLQPGRVSSFVRPLPPGDFLDTAHIIDRMDHVVTVDTAVAHLAGAMGHPSTHVLIPYQCDWRWYFGHAWYPTLKFYRQKQPGDWAEPFAMLGANLRRQ